MTYLPTPIPPGPTPGEPGHFASHDWIEESLHALDDQLQERMPYAMATGTGNVNLSAATSGNVAVTFPAGRFSAIPTVTPNQSSGAGGTQTLVPRVLNPTVNGCSLYVYAGNSLAVTAQTIITFIAVQMTRGTGTTVEAEGAVAVVLTCRHPGCSNADIPITLHLDELPDRCQCGVCGQEITDTALA